MAIFEPEEASEKELTAYEPIPISGSFKSDDLVEKTTVAHTSGPFTSTTGTISTGTFVGSGGTISWPEAPMSEEPKIGVADGVLMIHRDEFNGTVTAQISGSKLVSGAGDDAVEAVEDLSKNISALLDFSAGANGVRPNLHSEFSDQIKQLTEWSKVLGIYIP